MNTSERLLVIDDEVVVLDSCMHILMEEGYLIATVESGQAGLEIFKTFLPDLVLVDLMMPGITGFEILEQIRTHDPAVVLVAISRFATINAAVEAMKKGAYDFLPKPFTPDELRLTVKRGLEKRKLQIEATKLRRERDALRNQFAAIISHELKSPLDAVQQNLYAMADDLDDRLTEDEKSRWVRLQLRMDDLMNLIQTWHKAIVIDPAALKDDFSQFPIAQLTNRAVDAVRPLANRKAIDISVTTDHADDQITGNLLTLIEALVNVLNNAVVYTPMEGHIWVESRMENGCVLISVRDDGVGILEEDLPYLFEIFYQGQIRFGNQYSSGVGLALTRRIIEMHGGSLHVKSKPGAGSTFTLRLPLATNLPIRTAVPDQGMATEKGHPDEEFT